MSWTIINYILLGLGIVCGIKGWVIGQKSEAYDAYTWLACGVVLSIISGISFTIKHFFFK